MYRNDRRHKRGGGFSIYVKKDIKSFVVAKSSDRQDISAANDLEYETSGVQFLFLELILNTKRLLVGVVYNLKPTLHKHRDNLLKVFDNLFSQYEDIVMMGDFNTDILQPNKNLVSNFKKLLAEFDLQYFKSGVPTHFPYGQTNLSPSCIDLVITNRLNNIINFSQIDLPGVSNHDLIYFSYNIPIGLSIKSPCYVRDYRSIDIDSIHILT